MSAQGLTLADVALGEVSRSDFLSSEIADAAFALGEGEIDISKAVQCLREAGYDGVWCCEYEGRENDGTGQKKCYEYMKANL